MSPTSRCIRDCSQTHPVTSWMEGLDGLNVKMERFLLSGCIASSLREKSVQNPVCENSIGKDLELRGATGFLSEICKRTGLEFHPRVGKE